MCDVKYSDVANAIFKNSKYLTEDEEIPDLSKLDQQKIYAVENPANAEAFLELKKRTKARIGLGRSGPRYKTDTLLRLRADHAAAMDAVHLPVTEELLERHNLFCVKTLCDSKATYLSRPDLGRLFSEDAIALIKEKCKPDPDVEIYVSDGLSGIAVEANIDELLPAILQGLEAEGIEAGTPFFVKYGRVAAQDQITKVLNAKVCVVLLGERPGLATAESLSAYMTYCGYPGMPELGRTVISNIHRGGTHPAEAGAHIAYLIKEMLKQKASGQDLRLK
jgi:ethanolamine ammonia-lyase small subunit